MASSTIAQTPLRFDPSVEMAEADETRTTDDIIATMRQISETTFKDYGHAVRSVHAKSHGLLDGELTVLDGLPREYAQGLFARPGRYPVKMRLSTVPGDILPDSVSTPRGLAIKVIGVEGERLPGADGATQDFVLVNGPAFQAPTLKAFLGSLKMLAKTTDKVEGLKKAASAALRGTEAVLEAFGGQSAMLKSMGGQAETHILGDTFYSQVPIRHGDYIAKVSAAPISPALRALAEAPLDLNGNPDALRQAVVDFFHREGGEWEVRVQLCTDIETMPVEDASVVWPEDKSPYTPVVRIRVAPQEAWSEARAAAFDDGLSFSPWHGLAAHRPLGAIMRARRPAYEMGARFRSEHNGCPIGEPRLKKALAG